MSEFERFVYKKRQVPGEAIITLTKSGIIAFNVATMTKYVKDSKFAILFYNKDDHLVGIQLTNTKTLEGYPIRKYRNKLWGSISGMAFLNYYKIPHKVTKSYSVKWDESENMLIIELKKREEKRSSSKQNKEDPF